LVRFPTGTRGQEWSSYTSTPKPICLHGVLLNLLSTKTTLPLSFLKDDGSWDSSVNIVTRQQAGQ
jgi:hypothetical protein